MENNTQVIEQDTYVAFPPARRSLAVTSVPAVGTTLSSLGLVGRQGTDLSASAAAMTRVLPTAATAAVVRSAVMAGAPGTTRYIDPKTVVRFDDVDPLPRTPPV